MDTDLLEMMALFYGIISVLCSTILSSIAAMEIFAYGQGFNTVAMIDLIVNAFRNIVLPDSTEFLIRVILSITFAVYLKYKPE